MSIEAKYNELREAALDARLQCSEDNGLADSYVFPRTHARAKHRTAVAAERWPEARAKIAETGKSLPNGPVVWTVTPYGAISRSSRNLLPEEDVESIVAEGNRRALAELEPIAIAAEEAFERYRLAVAQGVAVDPDAED